MAAVLLILLAAWWLRVVGLDGMRLTGDAAYSVHVAGASLAEITLGRVSDGHPPLYYWLLHATIGLFGATEYAARLPTAMTGLLTIPFAWQTARRLAPSTAPITPTTPVILSAANDPSPSPSLPSTPAAHPSTIAPLAAALVAFSPLLVFYSRDPRMYALLPLAAIASTMLLERGRWPGYAAAALVGLWSHYYMLPLVAGQALWLLLFRRSALRSAVPTFAVVGLGFAPWLL